MTFQNRIFGRKWKYQEVGENYVVKRFIIYTLGAGVAQSVQRLATGWTAEGSEFESRWGQDFSPLHVQTGSGAHPMGSGDSLPEGNAARS
jgi:hypothetical protein